MACDSSSMHHFITMPPGLDVILHFGNTVSELIAETLQSNCKVDRTITLPYRKVLLAASIPISLATSRLSGLQAILDLEYRTDRLRLASAQIRDQDSAIWVCQAPTTTNSRAIGAGFD